MILIAPFVRHEKNTFWCKKMFWESLYFYIALYVKHGAYIAFKIDSQELKNVACLMIIILFHICDSYMFEL